MVERCRRVALQMHRLAVANPTGVHRYATELARALSDTAPTGSEVELWYGATAAADPAPGGVTARTWPVHRRLLHASWMAFRRPLAERYLGDVSIVHSLTPAVPVPTRAPLVVTVHDVMTEQHPEWYTPFARTVVGAALRHAALHASRIITPSQAVAGDVRAVLGVEPARLVVVPEGVDERFRLPVPPAEQERVCGRFGLDPGGYVVAVGEVGPRKNLALLVEALAQLPPAGRLTLAVVGGDGGSAAELRERAQARGISADVRWTGRVDDDVLLALLAGARALVHPSRYEGFGLTPLEAMAAGVPVLAGSVGAVPEVVGDAGMLLDPGDTSAWAAALATIASDDGVAGDLAERGVTRAGAFSWGRTAAETWAVYDVLS